MGTTSYSNLRENLAEIWDKVEDSQEPASFWPGRGREARSLFRARETRAPQAGGAENLVSTLHRRRPAGLSRQRRPRELFAGPVLLLTRVIRRTVAMD